MLNAIHDAKSAALARRQPTKCSCSLKYSVLLPLREVTEDIYDVQTNELEDSRDLVFSYLDLVSPDGCVLRGSLARILPCSFTVLMLLRSTNTYKGTSEHT